MNERVEWARERARVRAYTEPASLYNRAQNLSRIGPFRREQTEIVTLNGIESWREVFPLDCELSCWPSNGGRSMKFKQ